MKYQSELIKEIIDMRGHDKSSLHYESECIESWIAENKGGYPKLCDYQAEWLNYINEKPIGEFPYQTLVDVTNATIDNVVPYAYQSAILKGDTKFINEYGVEQADKTIFHSCYFEQGTIGGNIGSTISKEDLTSRIRTINPLSLEIGSYSIAVITGYEVYVKIINSTNNIGIRQVGFDSSISFNITDSSKEKVYIAFRKSGNANITTDEVERIVSFSTIPELTSLSLVSVKMPVLTTTGKNLYNPSEAFIDGKSLQNVSYSISVKPNQSYTFYPNGKTWVTAILYNKNDNETRILGNSATSKIVTFTPFNNEVKAILTYFSGSNNNVIDNIDFTGVQLEEGTQPTPYEPYKANILTVNEEVELRGIGEVKDELNCLTGEVTERVGKIVLDGSQSFYSHSSSSSTTLMVTISDPSISFKQNTSLNESWNFSDVICDEMPIAETPKWEANEWERGYNIVLISSASPDTYNINSFVLAIRKSYFRVQTIQQFQAWLTQNPLTIQYKMYKESIKTVDLMITNQNGESLSKISPIEGTMHLTTSSDTIPPLFSGEIPVEAITQNLASFIKE